MSRRHSAEKRKTSPDVKYGSLILAKFINSVMKDGKKSLAEKIVYNAFSIVEKKHKTDPFEVFQNAISNTRPDLEVVSVRVGGANYQVPSPVDEKRGNTLATRWIIDAAKKRSENDMVDKLAAEFFDASNNRGASVKKREDTHKMAESNKAFAHFSPKKNTTN